MHLGVILSFSLLLVVSAYDRGGDANWRSLSRKRKDADTRQSGNRKGVTNGKGDNFDANQFLEKYGYLDDPENGNSHSEQSTADGIREFQRFNGLPVTGRLDNLTLKKMQQPRCGIPDVVKPSQRPVDLRGRHDESKPLAFYTPGYKWDKRVLTYKVVKYTRQLGGGKQDQAFHNAFRKWADVVPLSFKEVRNGVADIDIFFARGDHGDSPGNAFDGRGRTLAHAFFPAGQAALSGDTHFDDDEQWTLESNLGTNLEIVAAHEFGHALGMGHSNVQTALMAPVYQGYDPNYKLHPDDIRGIQTLYGSGRGSVLGSVGGGSEDKNTPRPVPAPRPSTRRPPLTIRPSTGRPVPTNRPPTTRPVPASGFCNLMFDAIDENSDGYVYAFRGSRVYKMDSRGIRANESIRSVFPNAPSSPGAVVYDRYRNHFYFFQDARYWRYTRFRLDEGYPKPLPADFSGVTAALQLSDRGIYLIKGKNFMRWAEGLTRFSQGFPRLVAKYWRDVPSNVDAAMHSSDGFYYFFKGQRYWKYNESAQLEKGYPKDTRGAWLSCGTRVPRR